MLEHQHLRRCLVAASQHGDQAEYLADQQVDDLERPSSQSSPRSAGSAATQVNQQSSSTGCRRTAAI
jgi:hypothetical protein